MILHSATNNHLSPRSVFIGGALLVAVFAAYCVVHEFLRGGNVQWWVSLVWALLMLLPWIVAWQSIGRWQTAGDGHRLRVLKITLVVLAATLFTVAAERALSLILYGELVSTMALHLFRRAPVALIMWALFWVMLRPRRISDVAKQSAATPPFQWPCALDEAQSIHAAGNYIEIRTCHRQHLVRLSMREAESRLAGAGWIRIHRSILLNSRHAAGILREDGRITHVKLHDARTLAVGRGYQQAVKARLDVSVATHPSAVQHKLSSLGQSAE
jgi:LytTr DNA-binding domain